MTDGSTITLRVMKSTWGISIRLTARLIDDESKSSQYFVTDKIGLSTNSIGIKLVEEEILMLTSGLRWVSNEIEKRIEPDKFVVIELVKVEFAEADFQSEGLYYGIATWASEHFDFTLPNYEVHFDKRENKYKFPDIELREGN
ncbi:MAG: hypothetical protein J7604_19285 [Sporocytophaga sp.]|uniref:hypothetical protein n=1 Tax=Sporocytophaga sp. TaxID=2231183 RepID=UPI001B07350C|nr:hypothetical protein [Sporocytophaga sp.]MBO9702363.1 hypothetical protein [Sporocytophaga sp.]